MAGLMDDPDRQVVPLWRNFTQTKALGELASLPVPAANPFTDSMVAETLADWREQRGLSTAADLVSVAFTLGRFEIARDAAEYVLSQENVPYSAKSVAEYYLSGGKPKGIDHSSAELPPQPTSIVDQLREGIRETRKELIFYPRNPMLWNNLARLYTGLGQDEKAKRAITAALSLAPTNRFVLRSAARFYLHEGDRGRAKRLLSDAPNVKSDPWVLASEIAISAAVKKVSSNLKYAKQILDAKKLPPFHLSELASAVGTIESLNGNLKNGRKLIAYSLERPAENSVAQAAWLARNMKFYFPLADVRISHEVNAWSAYQSSNWQEALSESRAWVLDQPFSSRPAVLGSYLASVALEDFVTAIKFARYGLRSNPDAFTLRNNLAVALAKLGDVAGAISELKLVNPTTLTQTQQIAYMATNGMIEYRSNRLQKGKELYLKAIERARQCSDDREHIASIYLAFEELRAGTSDAESFRARALEASNKLTDPSHLLLVDRLRNYNPIRSASGMINFASTIRDL